MRTKVIGYLLLLLTISAGAMVALAHGADQPQKWAILIGVSDYDDPQITDLPYVRNDVEAVYDALTSPPGGFEKGSVRILKADAEDPSFRPTRMNIIRRLKTLAQLARPGDLVLFYFSGHGDSDAGRGYLLPTDAETVDIPYSSVDLEKVHRELEKSGAAVVVEVIDACFSGVAAKGGEATMTEDFAKAVVPRAKEAAETGRRGWITLASCGPEQESYPLDPSRPARSSSSAFTHFFARGLRGEADSDGNGRIAIEELSRYVEGQVVAWADEQGLMQKPQFKLAGSSDLGRLPLLDLGGAVEVGILRVTSEPDGAAIWLDYRDTGKLTPVTIKNLRVGGHVVQVRLEGHDPWEQQITVEHDRTLAVQATLRKRVVYGQVSGRVVDPNGKPVVGALVVLVAVGATNTDADGHFTFRHVQQGQYDLRVSADGYKPGEATARTGQALEVGLALAPTPRPGPSSTGRPWERPGTQLGQEITGPAGIKLVWVPGGSFMMGSNDGDDDEKPVHEVELDGFWIGKTEVTVAQWRSVMGSVPEHNDRGDDHPVVWVSWDDCQEFCEKVGLSLPTEAQWEYAARGPESRVYPWGDEWDPKRVCCHENRGPGGRMFPVGSFSAGASWCGALDMAGNVYEWCGDCYDEDCYAQSPRRNPTGPAAGEWRVLRGGSWGSSASICRSAARRHRRPEDSYDDLGFRVARSWR